MLFNAVGLSWLRDWIILPFDDSKEKDSAIAEWTQIFAVFTASGIESPRARFAVIAAERQQPVPCVKLISIVEAL